MAVTRQRREPHVNRAQRRTMIRSRKAPSQLEFGHDPIRKRLEELQGQSVPRRATFDGVHKGEFVFLVGPSGSGKTTFLRLLLREDPRHGADPRSGAGPRGNAESRSLTRRNLGCVFQDFRLLPNKTVVENVAFALEVIGRPDTWSRRRSPRCSTW